MHLNQPAFPLFTAASLILGITCTVVLVIFAIYGRLKPLHKVWMLFNSALAVWAYGAFFIGKAENSQDAIILWRIAFGGVIFVSIFFYHFTCLFCQVERPKILVFAYLQGLFFCVLNFTDFYIFKIFLLKESIYYIKTSGFFYPTSVAIWFLLLSLALLELITYLKKAKNLKRSQALYLLMATVIGFSSGTTNFLPVFGIDIYPYGNVFIPFYCIIVTYAILKYQLLDIKIVITRVGIFLLVYALVSGIPFWVGWKILGIGNWLIPTSISTLFASLGPFIYLYLQRKAEDQILQEERRIQWLLKKASMGMSAVRDVQKLLGLIIDVLIRNLHLEYAALYLFDEAEDGYTLQASEPKNIKGTLLNDKSPLIERLKEKKYPILYEEINYLLDNPQEGDDDIKEILYQIRELSAAVVVPAIKENILLGFIVVGKRREKEVYSAELLDVLSILGNDAAVNIENAMYIEAENKRLEEEGKNIRRMHLDTMVSTIAHEINNPMHVIDGEMGGLLDICEDGELAIEEFKPLVMKKAKKMRDIAHGVSHLVNNIRNFSKGQINVCPVKISDLLENAGVFLRYELKTYPDVKYVVNVEKELPSITADMNLAIEVSRNFISNALHATKRNEGLKEVTLNISRLNGKFIRLEVIDNGYGIDEVTKKKLFETTYTSKPHSEGTGLGLWRIRKVCEFMGAVYGFDSAGRGEGARFWVDFEIAET